MYFFTIQKFTERSLQKKLKYKANYLQNWDGFTDTIEDLN